MVGKTTLDVDSIFVENLRTESRDSFALLVDMNEIFEDMVARIVTQTVADKTGWTVETQASIPGVVTGGDSPITMRPDVLVRDATDDVVLVADAKWKTPNKVTNSDVYQLVAYQSSYDVPRVLLYPAQDEGPSTTYEVQNAGSLFVIELPTKRSPPSDDLDSQLVSSFSKRMSGVLSR